MSATFAVPEPEELDDLAKVLGHAFAIAPATEGAWLSTIGRENLRIVRDPDGVRAGMGLVTMGQFFGGRAVSIAGVCGVGVRADHLRRGAATHMVSSALAELHERGIALATLYASTWSLYRRVGFEVAGTRSLARLSPQVLRCSDHELPVRLATASDRPAVAELYREHAREHDGHLDRGPYIWRRIDDVRFDVPAHGLLVDDDRGLAGYVYYRKHSVPGRAFHRIELTDLCARSPAAWRRLWSALADLGTMAEQIDLPTAPHDPGFLIHDDPRFRMELFEDWMVRVTHLVHALEQRGYAPDVRAQIDLDLADDVVPEQAGRWRLEVADGRGHVERGGAGTLRVDARGLSALFSGFVPATTLARLGRLDASTAVLGRAQTVFGACTPWMREMF